MDFDFKALLKTVAPWIGTALGSPLGGLAIEVATQALGASEKTTEGLKNALAGATPADMLALKKADQDFEISMKELGFKTRTELEAISAGDRKDARDMQKTTRSRMPAFLTTLVTVGYFGVLTGMMAGWLKVNDSQALLLMLGSLTTAWVSVVAFWVGTTHDSGNKTQLLAQAEPIRK